MLVYNAIKDIPNLSDAAVTIGMFDGVHLGHKKILQTLNTHSTKIAITFSKPPKSFLLNKQHQQIISLRHKLMLLKENGIDIAVVLNFSSELAKTSYFDFLTLLKKHTNFSQLVLGDKASFGSDKEGDQKNIRTLEKEMAFKSVYLPRDEISSFKIKESIKEGDLKTAEKMLGRNHSILPEKAQFNFLDENILQILPDNIQLPPDGDYLFKIKTVFPGKVKNGNMELHVNLKEQKLFFNGFPLIFVTRDTNKNI